LPSVHTNKMTKKIKLEKLCTFATICEIAQKKQRNICTNKYMDCVQYKTIIEDLYSKYLERDLK